MNIAVINFSGNVGKSTIARHLLAPRMRDAKVIAIESINVDDSAKEDDEKLRGRQFGELQARLLSGDNLVVDVGASNVEAFIALMSEFDGSHEDFDLFVVPVVRAEKQQRDTISTLDSLSEMGIPAQKIVVVFNQIDRVDGFSKDQFMAIFNFHEKTGCFRLHPEAYLHQSDVYEYSIEARRSISEILADTTDYKEGITLTPSAEEKKRLLSLLAFQRLSGRVKAELDNVFEIVAGKCSA